MVHIPENSALGIITASRGVEASPRAFVRFVRNFGLYIPLSGIKYGAGSAQLQSGLQR